MNKSFGENKMIFTDTRRIYDHLQDEVSRKLFAARLNVSATGEARYLTMLPAEYRNLSADIEQFRMKLLSNDVKKTVIFGAGFNGITIAQQIHMESLIAFIDSNRGGQIETSTNLPIFSLDDYIQRYGTGDTRFIISVSDRYAAGEMYGQLIQKEVDSKKIIMIPSDYRNNVSQYFDLFVPEEHETFVDCGCFDAGTAFRFAGWCGTKEYDKIWCFEPDRVSYEISSKACARLTNCYIYPYGISDRKGTAMFASDGKENSKIVSQSEKKTGDMIETIALDEFLRGERITFIKMDIEGAERDALKGAEQIIKAQKPKLAISIYHKPDDIVAIPSLILEMRMDYKFYIRHYSLLTNETILYAI